MDLGTKDSTPRAAGLGALSALDDSLVAYVLYKLDAASLCRLACASKLLRVYAYEEPLWVSQALQNFQGLLLYKVLLWHL
jgi:hypothetical protein